MTGSYVILTVTNYQTGGYQCMSGFFSGSSSRRRYPDPNMGGRHYKKKGLFGMIPGMGSFSGSGSYSGYGYPNQGYPGAGYSGQNYPNQGRQGQTQAGYQQHRSDGQASFQPNTPTASGQIICPKCGTAVPAGSKFCLECGEKMPSGPTVCSKCGKLLPEGAKFCLECGTPVRG